MDWGDVKFTLMATLVVVTVLTVFATPIMYLFARVGEASDPHADDLPYHWLAFLPLAVVVLIWVYYWIFKDWNAE